MLAHWFADHAKVANTFLPYLNRSSFHSTILYVCVVAAYSRCMTSKTRLIIPLHKLMLKGTIL